MRGTSLEGNYQFAQFRFIPACAGNIARATTRNRRNTVHPRVCGEHMESGFAPYSISGSSPRVRGTLRHRRHNITVDRFIPACAGNIIDFRPRDRRHTVHPRVCGEHPSSFLQVGQYNGSSPRVRGTFLKMVFHRQMIRFIPACAGNIWIEAKHKGSCAVHPRVCGEHSAAAVALLPAFGSSPRVRGT